MAEPGALPMEFDPQLSVVIPTLGRPELVVRLVRRLVELPGPHREILVIDQSSGCAADIQARLASLSGRSTRVIYRSLDVLSASAARNLGLVLASAPILLFLDDDMEIERPDFLLKHLRHYREPGVVAVTGQMLSPDGRTRSHRHRWSEHPRAGWLFFPSNFTEPAWLDSGRSGNLSVRRAAALQVGGMDEQYERGAHREETDFCLRLRQRYGKILFDPSASAIHLGEPTGGSRAGSRPATGLRPMHHVVGECYFLIKNLKEGRILPEDLWLHLIALAQRQLLYPLQGGFRPWLVPVALVRLAYGLWIARHKYHEGPRHLAPAGRTRPAVGVHSRIGGRQADAASPAVTYGRRSG